MKKLFSSLVLIYGIGLSTIFAGGLYMDMQELEKAVNIGSDRAELRHRINVFADGTWFLMANGIAIMGCFGLFSNNSKNKDQ